LLLSSVAYIDTAMVSSTGITMGRTAARRFASLSLLRWFTTKGDS
jgi:hypothetical protein